MTNELMEFEKLESALLRAGRELDYPPTPAIAVLVRAELMSSFEPPRNWVRSLVAVAVAVLLALALLVALPTTRHALGQLLGLGGLEIFYLTPTPAPTNPPTAKAGTEKKRAGNVSRNNFPHHSLV